MNESKIINGLDVWKITTLALLVVIIILGIALYTNYQESKEVYNFGDLTINKKVFNELSSYQEGDFFVLCDINEKDCVMVGRTKGLK